HRLARRVDQMPDAPQLQRVFHFYQTDGPSAADRFVLPSAPASVTRSVTVHDETEEALRTASMNPVRNDKTAGPDDATSPCAKGETTYLCDAAPGSKRSNSIIGGTVFCRSAPPRPTQIFDSYWRFAAERHAIFLRRVAGQMHPWTTDPI